MRVVICGAGGFIGSHLADFLLAEGHEVVGVDNFSTGRPENIAHLRGHGSFTFIQHDVTEGLAIDGVVDRIFHLASPASPAGFTRNQVDTLKANSQGVWNLLELAEKKNGRFLMASTSEVYGRPTVQPQREEYLGNVDPVGLRSTYDEARRFAEACTMAYHRERGVDTRIVRLFPVYGPRMDPLDKRVIVSFIRQALAGEAMTVLGDGLQTRSFCYVSDIVRGISAAMECDFHEPVNLGQPEMVSMIQLAREVREQVEGCVSQIVHRSAEPDDQRLHTPDISRARQLLGWTPVIPRKVGIGRTIEYCRQAASGLIRASV